MAAMACSRAQIFSDAETGAYNTVLPRRDYNYDNDEYGSKCFCCPYGYHIDLDFVRYCESWQADASDRLQHERRRRRARHKQRQSMDFLLGLPDENKATVYQPPSEPLKKPVPPKPPPKPSLDSIRLNQDWQESLSNFEEALSQSYSGPSSSACSTPVNNVYLSSTLDGSSPSVQNGNHDANHYAGTTGVAPAPPQRSDSHSSPYLRKPEQRQPPTPPPPPSISASRLVLERQLAEESANRVDSVESRPCLQSIREQMATALERMKQLEEQVKEIPLLHVQMSVLREERRILLRQLASQKKLNHQQLPQQVSRRDAATSCAVVTRDVGVTHQPTKLRDSSTSCTRRALSAHATEATSIAPEATTRPTSCAQSTQCTSSLLVAKAVQSESLKPAQLATKSTQCEPGRRAELATRGTQCSVETRERGTLSLEEPRLLEFGRSAVSRRNQAVQATETQSWAKLKLNAGVTAKPSVADVATETSDASISLSALRRHRALCSSKSVGTSVGRDLVRTVSRSTETLSRRSRDFGTSPQRKLLVDASVGGSMPSIASSTNYCDECKQTSKNKQQQRQRQQTKVGDKGKGGMRTRIPVMSPEARMERRSNLIRQDTWTESLDKLGDGSQSLNKHATDRQQLTSAASRKRDDEEQRELVVVESRKPQEKEEEKDDEELDDALVRSVVLDTPKVPADRLPMDLSKEMRAALKVLDDNLRKVSAGGTLPSRVKNASNIVQHEWFKISSTAQADPHGVEYYLDQFEQHSGSLLGHVVNLRDSNGNTAMHYAVSHGNFDVVSILLDSKVCDVNGTNHAGYTPVMLAALVQLRNSTHASVVKRLFQMADVNVRAKLHGQTALMLAVSHGRKDMSRLLIDAGAAVNLQDEDGSTALMCAAEHGHADIVRLLLAHPDCDSGVIDVDGSTALKIAVEAGHAEVGMLLYAHQRANRASPMPPPAPKLGRRQRTVSGHHNHHSAMGQYSALSMSAPASPVATASRKFHSSSLSLVDAPKYSL